jgi:hypothetical protein
VLGGVAALGAGVLLAACAPVQMGAAAIVGNQRITQSALDAQVSNLQSAVAKYPAGEVQLTSAQMPQAVLGWLVKFAIMNTAATSAGVTVSNSQIQQGEVSIQQQAQQYASESGLPSATLVLLSTGVPPQLLNSLGKYQAQELELAMKANGGKLPTTQDQSNTVDAALTKSTCQAAKSLSIRINPQYGRFDYSQYTVVDGPDVLSKAVGASPASTTGTAPAC